MIVDITYTSQIKRKLYILQCILYKSCIIKTQKSRLYIQTQIPDFLVNNGSQRGTIMKQLFNVFYKFILSYKNYTLLDVFIFIIFLVVDLEVSQFIRVFSGSDNPQPISQIVFLQVFLCKVLQVSVIIKTYDNMLINFISIENCCQPLYCTRYYLFQQTQRGEAIVLQYKNATCNYDIDCVELVLHINFH